MKKKILLLFLNLITTIVVIGQNNRDYVVVYSETVPYDSLFQYFHQNRIPSSERASIALHTLKQVSDKSGRSVEQFLGFLPKNKASYSKHYIFNGIQLNTSPEIANQIAQMEGVLYVEDITDIKVFLIAPVQIREEEAGSRAVGSAEPGLVAVGAPFMWNLGYTGKGIKVLSFDTGIWPSHPALGGRFMGEYFPLDRAWKGYFSPTPVDKANSHGTHTVGTMSGLDPQTQDTIGLAFGAYFMATDPIVSNISDTLGMPNLILAYEWALNPDGDINTVNDIPDVICNSWGSSGNAGFCGSFVADMLQSIDLVGIANEYSAGNNGPGPGSVGIVALVSPSELNAFAVGAINGNTSSYPIASFSSRGPTPCLGGGSLEIKPEVVAPGVNVRSCVKQNGYSSYDGTSMAGPHVAGAMLLLKEAFPYLPGDIIKAALYFSAIDLGDPGEDNTFGMGIIHVGQAYNWLVNEGYNPVPPTSATPEMALLKNRLPFSGVFCSSQFQEPLKIYNEGVIPIQDTVFFTINLNGSQVLEWEQFVVISPGDTVQISIPSGITLSVGMNEIWISAVQKNTPVEKDNINNHRTYRFSYIPSENVPYMQRFEEMNYSETNWTVINPDVDRTFELSNTQGQDVGTRSAAIKFLLYTPVNGQKDWLVSPPVELLPGEQHYVAFDIAYQIRTQNQKDTVALFASRNCGISFDEQIFQGSPEEMVTLTASSPSNFTPSISEHWKRIVFPIPTDWGGEQVIFAFRSINNRGANAFIDDFAVFSGADPLSISQFEGMNVQVFPNPFSESLTITFDQSEKSATFMLYDIYGRNVAQVKSTGVLSYLWTLPQTLTPGVYYLELKTGKSQKIVKLIKAGSK